MTTFGAAIVICGSPLNGRYYNVSRAQPRGFQVITRQR